MSEKQHTIHNIINTVENQEIITCRREKKTNINPQEKSLTAQGRKSVITELSTVAAIDQRTQKTFKTRRPTQKRGCSQVVNTQLLPLVGGELYYEGEPNARGKITKILLSRRYSSVNPEEGHRGEDFRGKSVSLECRRRFPYITGLKRKNMEHK